MGLRGDVCVDGDPKVTSDLKSLFSSSKFALRKTFKLKSVAVVCDGIVESPLQVSRSFPHPFSSYSKFFFFAGLIVRVQFW